MAVYRLYNTRLGTHFFTINAAEATYAMTIWPWFADQVPSSRALKRRHGRERSPDGNARGPATTGKVGDFVT